MTQLICQNSEKEIPEGEGEHLKYLIIKKEEIKEMIKKMC